MSSSETKYYTSWNFNLIDGHRGAHGKSSAGRFIRSLSYLENRFDPREGSPKIGDVMYSDLSYGSAGAYDSSKTAVGVVTWVSEDGRSAKIMNLKDLSFSSHDQTGNFNPDKPYDGTVGTTSWSTVDTGNTDITNITDYDYQQLPVAAQSGGKITVSNTNLTTNKDKIYLANKTASYHEILSQYDSLIKDSSYKGINLLREQDLTVTFNEDRSAQLSVQGKDASAKALGLVTMNWETQNDVAQSLSEIAAALNQIRQMSSELGNYYSIVTTRENFTQNLINVLTEGADKLTLADMNEESANMLALQTRQQLAVNSLSLASQASQSILKLF